jgi:hypothetical protein
LTIFYATNPSYNEPILNRIIVGIISSLIVLPVAMPIVFLFQHTLRPRTYAKRSEIVPRQFAFPPWFRFVIYLFCFGLIGLAIYVLMAYGVLMSSDVAVPWLIGFGISIAESIFFSQSIKVFIISAWKATCQRPRRLKSTSTTLLKETGSFGVL